MLNLTKKQAVEEHRKMWNWIADETLKRKTIVTKEDYFDEVYPDDLTPPKSHCFCCEYDKISKRQSASFCVYCPIVWPCGYCGNELSPFYKWLVLNRKEASNDYPIEWDYENNSCSVHGSLHYTTWCNTTDYREAAEYARMIAELPEREDMGLDDV